MLILMNSQVWSIAVYGGNVLFVFSMLLAVLVGLLLRVHPAHSLFVAACLSLSSGPLAQRLIGKETCNLKPEGLLHSSLEGYCVL